MKKPLELTNQKETNLKMKNPECLLRTTKGRAEPSSRFFKIQILSGSLVDNVPPLPIFGSGGGGAPCVPPCFSHFVCHCDFNPQRPKELCIKPSEQVKAKVVTCLFLELFLCFPLHVPSLPSVPFPSCPAHFSPPHLSLSSPILPLAYSRVLMFSSTLPSFLFLFSLLQ
eukprot:TRINITY_DN9070_c1_g1_i2.p1 TRINITY_DN9070_c1_g1~~TRINITY_DN9070_c1_g1_i2.p1  ORF type:complete len:169 (+),score=39.21 TRINITY_DN9070_c1_g1_i2:1169-1675(+)